MKKLIVCALFVLFSCAPKKEANEVLLKSVKVSETHFVTVANKVQGFGTLSFLKKFDVSSPQDGELEKLYFREGAEVRAGDVLAKLDNKQIILALGMAENSLSRADAALSLSRAALLEAEFRAEAQLLNFEKTDVQMTAAWRAYYENERKFNSQNILFLAGGVNEESMRVAKFSLDSEFEQIKLAEKELEIQKIGFRDRDLVSAGIPVPEDSEEKKKALIELCTARSRAELTASLSSYEAAKKELESAVVAKDELVIKSPARGIIVSRILEEGERIKRDDKIFTIIDSESLYATIQVQEKDAFRLKKGMQSFVEIDGNSTVYNGSVDMISPIADSQSFTFSVRILLPKEVLTNKAVLAAKPGMFARVVISAGDDENVLTVKDNALINKKNGEAYCFVVSGKMLSMHKLVLGDSIADEWIVLSGLSQGDKIVLSPDASLKEGEYVEIII